LAVSAVQEGALVGLVLARDAIRQRDVGRVESTGQIVLLLGGFEHVGAFAGLGFEGLVEGAVDGRVLAGVVLEADDLWALVVELVGLVLGEGISLKFLIQIHHKFGVIRETLMWLPHRIFSHPDWPILLSSHLTAFFQHGTHVRQRWRHQLFVPAPLVIGLIEISVLRLTWIKVLLVVVVLVSGSTLHADVVSIQTLVVEALAFFLHTWLVHVQLIEEVVVHFAILLISFRLGLGLVQLLA
jgi:hypothetical protein